MKKQNLNASSLSNGKVLSRNEMKDVLGGGDDTTIGTIGGGAGTCSVTVSCQYGTSITCNGSGAACSSHPDSLSDTGWVQCDQDPKVYCSRP